MYLSAIREKLGMSQYRLSKLSGVSQAHISDIEHGKKSPTLYTLQKLAKALKVSVNQLIGEEPDKK